MGLASPRDEPVLALKGSRLEVLWATGGGMREFGAVRSSEEALALRLQTSL